MFCLPISGLKGIPNIAFWKLFVHMPVLKESLKKTVQTIIAWPEMGEQNIKAKGVYSSIQLD